MNPNSAVFFFFFFFLFFCFSKPNAVFFFFFVLFFFLQNNIYCICSLPLAWLVQKTDTHDRFFQKFVLVTFVMWTENKLLFRKGISWKQNDNHSV